MLETRHSLRKISTLAGLAFVASQMLFVPTSPAFGKTITVLEDDDIDRRSQNTLGKHPNSAIVPTPRTAPVRHASLSLPTSLGVDIPTPRVRPASLFVPLGNYKTGLISKSDQKHYSRAFKEMGRRHWRKALKAADKAQYKLPAKYIRWNWLRTYKGGASFDAITSFVIDNPDWPYRETLMRRAEEALVNPVSTKRTLAWFSDRTPLTGMGMLRYGEALLANGNRDQGEKWIHTAWIEGNFSAGLEKKFIRQHKSLLSSEDHKARLDRLLWDRRAVDAIRMLDRVDKNSNKLAVARIRLMRMSKNVDAALRRIPDELKNDPGLQYERARWRRRKGKHEGAREILLKQDELTPRPDKWWAERHIQARKLLNIGHISEAYRLVSSHGLKSGGKFAAAEWISGWISLRFLHDYDIALKHFTRLYNNVSFPISRSRGAYWLGRTYAIKNDIKSATYWYGEAARHTSSFYGQMAFEALGHSDMPTITRTPKPSSQVKAKLDKSELVKVIEVLAEFGQAKRARPFLLRLTEQAKNPEEYVYLSTLARDIGRPDYAVTVAKRASQLGTDLTDISWPAENYAPGTPPIEVPLILAITRQESAFASDAISRAGARGLMQLMPATARDVSRKLKVSYSKSKLITNPSYNTLLGSTYLRTLINRFDGSYILAVASYNAGPSRVKQWIREWGDPRKGDIDVIDWIELIPFTETRNYVQRVMENLQVYRQLLGNTGNQMVQIETDLSRGRSTF